MRQSQSTYKRIVVKLGSSLFYSAKALDLSNFCGIVSEISGLIKKTDLEVVVVSSGAIALGMDLLKIESRPKGLPLLQAAAAVGQNALMDNYSRHFARSGINCAQVLLTWDDFSSRQRYLNAKNTILTLWKLKSIPVVNENDTISADDIKIGDNDKLSSLVASMDKADLLIMLSDVDGLLDRQGKVVRVVEEIGLRVRSLVYPAKKQTSVGGMITKLEAAKIATAAGIPCVIANGCKQNIILSVVEDPENNGTLFVPKK